MTDMVVPSPKKSLTLHLTPIVEEVVGTLTSYFSQIDAAGTAKLGLMLMRGCAVEALRDNEVCMYDGRADKMYAFARVSAPHDVRPGPGKIPLMLAFDEVSYRGLLKLGRPFNSRSRPQTVMTGFSLLLTVMEHEAVWRRELMLYDSTVEELVPYTLPGAPRNPAAVPPQARLRVVK
jgi:hypothetical protein